MLFTELENQKFKTFLSKFIPKMVRDVEFIDFECQDIHHYGGLTIKVKYQGNTKIDEGEYFRIYYDIEKVISFYESNVGSFSVNFQ